MKRPVLEYLQDIQESMQKTQRFIEGMNYQAFEEDERTNFATVRALEIVGEATKHIPEEVCVRFPEIPWRDMAGMRDKVIHAHFGVDLEVVWDTVTTEIPSALPALRECLETVEEQERKTH